MTNTTETLQRLFKFQWIAKLDFLRCKISRQSYILKMKKINGFIQFPLDLSKSGLNQLSYQS